MATPPDPTAGPRQMERPTNLPHGRWLGDFPDLSDAEQRLVECCRSGRAWAPDRPDDQPSDWPTAAIPENRIRAELIRFLVLGGDIEHPVHEAGPEIRGGWITGTLSLNQCLVPLRLSLRFCYFENSPCFLAANLPELDLGGSFVPALPADGMIVAGDVLLGDLFTAGGPVELLGATIGGNLQFDQSRLSGIGGLALIADGMRVVGDVFFRNGCRATGAVELRGVDIGGNLECPGGYFINPDGFALDLEGVNVKRELYIDQGIFIGAIQLTAAHIGTLTDDVACWSSVGHILKGFRYDRIIGPVDSVSRLDWLKSQRADQNSIEDWSPQPWEQLIKVLRETGHPGTAAEIAMEKQRMMRKAGQIGTRQPRTDFRYPWRNRLDARWAKLSNAVARGFHSFYGAIAGYGHRPTRIAAWMLVVWLACSLLFDLGREYGHFGPSNPVINANAALDRCGARGETMADGSPKAYWHSLSCPMPAEYTTLWPLAYSLDLILPLIDLQQDRDWAPIVVNENGEQQFWGYALRGLMWFEILFGWLASLMFVAIVSRLVDKD